MTQQIKRIPKADVETFEATKKVEPKLSDVLKSNSDLYRRQYDTLEIEMVRQMNEAVERAIGVFVSIQNEYKRRHRSLATETLRAMKYAIDQSIKLTK